MIFFYTDLIMSRRSARFLRNRHHDPVSAATTVPTSDSDSESVSSSFSESSRTSAVSLGSHTSAASQTEGVSTGYDTDEGTTTAYDDASSSASGSSRSSRQSSKHSSHKGGVYVGEEDEGTTTAYDDASTTSWSSSDSGDPRHWKSRGETINYGIDGGDDYSDDETEANQGVGSTSVLMNAIGSDSPTITVPAVRFLFRVHAFFMLFGGAIVGGILAFGKLVTPLSDDGSNTFGLNLQFWRIWFWVLFGISMVEIIWAMRLRYSTITNVDDARREQRASDANVYRIGTKAGEYTNEGEREKAIFSDYLNHQENDEDRRPVYNDYVAIAKFAMYMVGAAFLFLVFAVTTEISKREIEDRAPGDVRTWFSDNTILPINIHEHQLDLVRIVLFVYLVSIVYLWFGFLWAVAVDISWQSRNNLYGYMRVLKAKVESLSGRSG